MSACGTRRIRRGVLAAGIILCQALRVSEAGAQAQAQKEWPDDEPLVSFSTNLLTIREYDNAIEFGVHLSRAANATVAVSVAGTARHGETNDYVLSTTNLVFSENGPATQLLTLRPIQDTQREGSEYAVLGFGTLAGARPAGGANIHVIIRDDDALTIMAANLTGMEQMYREPSVRIFRGLLPDIVAIQEFKVADNNHRAFVDRAFGTNFYYMVEHSFRKVKFSIPNGIISRWPIIASGEWDDLSSWTRDFAWAIIDIPGSRNLHVVSVHFQYSGGDADRIREARDLVAYVRECVHPDDFLVIAGDLNTHGRNTEVLAILSAIVTDAHQPADQAGDLDTNHTRTGDLDYVLPSANLDALHIPLTLDNITFADGMVFDSTLWPVPPYPIEPNDSHERDMQHMAVMKAFALPQEVNVRVHSWAMEDRGDGDGLVEEGEPHRLSLVVENESGLCISNLALSITSESPDVILGQDYPRRLGDWPAHYAGPVPTCALAITSHVARVDQALRLQWTSDNGSWTSHIPFSVTVQRLPEALDNRDLAFRNGGDAIWAYQTRNAWDGEDAAQCQPLPASGQAYIETTVEGPGRVAFCWQLASPYHSDYMFFTMDQVFRTGNYHCAWTDVSQLVPPGNHVLRWTLFHHNSDPGGTGRLDHVRFAPFTNAVLQTSPAAVTRCVFTGQAASIPISVWNAGAGAGDMAYRATSSESWLTTRAPAGSSAGGTNRVTWFFTAGPTPATNEVVITVEAPDAECSPATTRVTIITLPSVGDAVSSNLAWSAGGSGGWFSQTNYTHEGAFALQSGAIGHSERSWIETKISGPGTLSFWWKVSSASNDCLRFFLNGIRQSPELSGSVDWQPQSYTLTAGDHVARWTYVKNARTIGGLDAGWLDAVRITGSPDAEPTPPKTNSP